MLSLSAESLCLINGKHNINQPIIPEEQEFVHFNTLWCYLFYKLTGKEKEDKGIDACDIDGTDIVKSPYVVGMYKNVENRGRPPAARGG